jgi:hypothetical protein
MFFLKTYTLVGFEHGYSVPQAEVMTTPPGAKIYITKTSNLERTKMAAEIMATFRKSFAGFGGNSAGTISLVISCTS